MAVCPFMSGWVFNGSSSQAEFQQKDCMGSSCALWDGTNGRCGIKVSDFLNSMLQSINSEASSMSSLLISINGLNQILTDIRRSLHEGNDVTRRSVGELLTQIKQVLHEENNESKRAVGELLKQIKQVLHEENDETKRSLGVMSSRLLSYLHEGNDESKRSAGELLTEIKKLLHEGGDELKQTITNRVLDIHNHIHDVIEPITINSNKHVKSIDYHVTRMDERSKLATVSYALILAQEFLQDKDFDGNGMIFGKDFKLENPPPILKALESNPEWKNPDKVLSLEEYRSSLSEEIERVVAWVYEEYENLEV